MSTEKKMMQIVGAVSSTADEKKTYWNRIGVAFQNKDGSWNLRFDYLPARMSETTIQLREIDVRDSKKAAE